MARSDPASALRLWVAHVSHALPPPPPAHKTVPRERRLCAARPRGAAPRPPQPGGHPHGVLPQLDGYGSGPQMGAVSPATHSLGPGGIKASAPRGPRLALWRGSLALAVPPPPLEGWRAALSGGPSGGTPLGPGFPPYPPRRGRHPAGVDQRPPAPGAPHRRVGQRGGGLWGPLGGSHPRRRRPVPLPGRQVPRCARGPTCGHWRGAGLDPAGVCRVVCGAACPGLAPAAPVPPRGRGSRPTRSCGRGGCAAGCRPRFTHPDPGVRAPGGRPLRLP